MHIVFYGPEGAGKGTQAKLLGEKLKIPILTSGDLVRDAATNDNGIIGTVCKQALEEGKYVADSEMFVLWKWRLKEKDANDNWIMDGFPRNVEQAKFLDEKLSKYGYRIEKVFYLKVPENISIDRLTKRARPLHPGSNELHDSPDRIKSRMELYKKAESDVIEFYRNKGVLIEVNGAQDIQNVHGDIMKSVSV